MRYIIVVLLISLVWCSGCSPDRSGEISQLKRENSELRALVGPPPASLDTLYPPKAPAPVYQLKMFELAGPLVGLIIRVNEGDMAGAQGMLEAFRNIYGEVSAMVPEWKDQYPGGPITELEGALLQKDPARIMGAIGAVAEVCHSCHVSNMAKVQQKFHWDDFSTVSLTDPATNNSVEWKEFMMSLDVSMVGITMELSQGQPDKARRHFELFKKGISELREACQTCHDTERKYFVSADVDVLIDQLGAALKSSSPDMKKILQFSQQIGTETCGKCHLVHIPAAYAKERWSRR